MNHSSRWTSSSFGFGGGGGDGGGSPRSGGVGNLSRMLSSPMAESTQLFGGSPTVTVSSGGVKRKPTSPLLNSKTSFKSSGNLSGFGGAAAASSSGSRIDPQVYTDAQSRGLVNRLVRYHDKTQSSLNRSHSMTSLYTKPGQFPVVHLKKTEIKYSPRRNNSITSVRIAPPEKSVFQANTRSNILRAGSLLIPSADMHNKSAVQRPPTEEEIDAENRVIAPTAELDAAPTRSVLDALKEISRKRINNEELDADRIKKQCKELSEVDSAGGGGVKRARELPSSASPPTRGSADQQKKRMCQKNNDISSSLSSSLVMVTPKRVEPVQMRPNRLNVDQSFSALITPATFNATIATVESRFEPAKLARMESAPLPQITRPVPEVVPRIVSQPVKPQPTQPRITLFNRKYDESQIRPVSLDEHEPEQDDDEELGGRISFIKPKEKSPIVSSDKLALKRVEKNKLSLLLSCLSDDFDNEEEVPKPVAPKDTVDAPPKAAPAKPEEKKPEPVALPKITGISALINNPIKDAGLGKIEPAPAAQKLPEPVKTTSGGFSFGTPAVAAVATPKPADTTFSFGTPAKPAEVKPPEIKPAFSFGTPAAAKLDPPPAYVPPTTMSAPVTTAAPTSTPTPNLISLSPAPLPTIAATIKPAQPTLTTVMPAAPSAFGAGTGFSAFKPPTSVATNVATNAATVAAAPPSSFSFGAPKPAATTSQPAAITTTTPTSSAFSFGGAKPITTAATAAAAPPPPAFGATSFAFGAASTATITSTTPSFGGFQQSAMPSVPTTAPPAFGSSNTATTVAAAPTNMFGNAATKPTFGQTSANSTFGFGGGAAATTTAPSNAASAFSFGGAANNSNNNSATNMFGNSNSNNSSSNNNANAMTFGGGASAPTFGTMAAGNVQAFGAVASTAAKPPAFGMASATPVFGGGGGAVTTTASNVFGAPTSNAPAPSPFGTPAQAPSSGMFGMAATSNNNNPAQSMASSASSAFSFGGASAAPTAAVTAQPAAANKPFAFGGAPPNATVTPAAQPIKSNSFSFSAGSNQAAPAAATPLGQSNSAFSFGQPQQQQQQTSNAPPPAFGSTNSAFSFAQSSNSSNQQQPASNQATVRPFSFGGSAVPQQAAAPPPAGGIFGGAAAAAASPPAFNFNQSAVAVAAPSPAGPFAFNSPVPTQGGPFAMANGAGAVGPGGAPMFSIGTGGGNQPPGRRPIRTATRRLK